MIVTEDKIDWILEQRKNRMLKKKKSHSFYMPKLKFSKLTGEKKVISFQIGIPINDNLTIRDRCDLIVNDGIDIKMFVKRLQDKYKFPDSIRESMEDQISYEIISHVEKVTLRTRMTKIQKMEQERQAELLKKQQEEEEKEEQVKENARGMNIVPRRKVRGSAYGDIPKNLCRFCGKGNHASEQMCRYCKLPFRLFGEKKQVISKSREIALGFLSRMLTRSDLIKIFGLLNKLEYDDCESILELIRKVDDLIRSRDDFDREAKDEVVSRFLSYAHNYLILGLGFAYGDLEYLDNKTDIAKERFKVVSERRGKPGRPKKSEVVKKSLRMTPALPVGRPKLTSEERQREKMEGRKRGRPPKRRRGQNSSDDISLGKRASLGLDDMVDVKHEECDGDPSWEEERERRNIKEEEQDYDENCDEDNYSERANESRNRDDESEYP